MGEPVRLHAHAAADYLPRSHPQGGHGCFLRDGYRALRDPVVGKRLHRLSQCPGAGTAFPDGPRPGSSGAGLQRRQQGGARAAYPPDHQHRPGQQLQLDLRRLRLHGRGRDHGCRHGAGRADLYRALLPHRSRCRAQGRGQAHRPENRCVRDAGHRQRHRPHAVEKTPRRGCLEETRGGPEAGCRPGQPGRRSRLTGGQGRPGTGGLL